MDMMDKTEAPTPQEGYNISIAFLALLEIVRSVQRIIEGHEASLQHNNSELELELINSSWSGVLAAFSLLLESSCDESATESILRANQNMVSLCGKLGIVAPRDAFVTALCKAALPHNYAMTLLSLAANQSGQRPISDSSNGDHHASQQHVERSQVVFVGSSGLPVAGLPSSSQLGPILLTAKNLQCMRAILSLTHCHGAVLGQSWYLVLTTLQHLVWILGLKVTATAVSMPHGSTPSSVSAASSAAVKSSSSSSSLTNNANVSQATASAAASNTLNPNSVVNTAVLADLPVLTTMLSRLFESSKYLDEDALNCLVDALCRLSREAIEVAKLNKDPSLFPVAKLTETGMVNMFRMQQWWNMVTSHLLDVCRVNHLELRPLAATSLVNLIRLAMEYKFEPPFWDNEAIHSLVLRPFSGMSEVTFEDVRRKQFESVQVIVHTYGQVIGPSWLVLLRIIGSIDTPVSDQLVRNAFQCLQLVISDYISSMQCNCYIDLVHVVTKFAKQKLDLNISLTAIGSIWHISDYFYQQWESQLLNVMQALPVQIQDIQDREALSMDQELWISIFHQLGQLCIDSRPAVRKSAGQTLFNTIESHGGLLELNSWQVVLHKVLFPLLQMVEEFSSNAPEERDSEEQGNLLMHHSRDTVAKQWAETRVLTLTGVAQLFAGPRGATLMQLTNYDYAWKLLLEYIEHSALFPNAEVALHSLKSLQELYHLPLCKQKLAESSPTVHVDDIIVNYDQLWWMGWETWSSIGTKATVVLTLPDSQSKANARNSKSSLPAHSRAPSTASQSIVPGNATLQKSPTSQIFVPTQNFLTLHMDLSCVVMERILSRLTEENLENYFLALRQALLIPISVSAAPFLLPTNYQESQMTPLQESALKSIKWVTKAAQEGSKNLHSLLPTIFLHVTDFVQFSIQLPKSSHHNMAQYQRDFTTPMSFVSFGEQCLKLVTELYQSCAIEQEIIDSGIMEEIIKVIHLPLSLKYNCPSQSTWKLAIQCFTAVLCVGIPVARKQKNDLKSLWSTVASTLHDFLFSNIKCPSTLSMEEFKEHEKMDCQFIHLIREQFLSNSTGVPDYFIESMIGLLNKGSIHSTTSNCLSDYRDIADDDLSPSADLEHGRAFRESFAELCFETLLKYSFRDDADAVPSSGQPMANGGGGASTDTVNKAAVRAILNRCKSVLVCYVEDDRLSGNCPLPRARLSEVAFVLKAMRTLLQTFKQTPKSKIDAATWTQVIDIYPHAVDCVMVASGQFMKPLRLVLHEYKDLMQPWTSCADK